MEDFHCGNQLKLPCRHFACFNGQLRLCLLFVLEGNGGVRGGVEGSLVERKIIKVKLCFNVIPLLLVKCILFTAERGIDEEEDKTPL